MSSTDENQLLTSTGPGTPCGDLMRRYWLPVALSEELDAGAPVAVRLLGEDLALFRDESGQAGLIGLHCAHRGADLTYGRLEDGGIRCLYHGWLYDIAGHCLEQPGEPPGSRFHERIRQTAYPCVERSGAVFAYMGPGQPPDFPPFDFLTVPNDQVFAEKLFYDCNYLQGNEGNIDLLHLSFLHHSIVGTPYGTSARRASVGAPAPEVSGQGGGPARSDAELLDFGAYFCTMHDQGDGVRYARMGTFLLPALAVIPRGHVNWHVPIDDTHHWRFTFIFDRDRPLDLARIEASRTDRLPGYGSVANRSNRYMQDRERMRTQCYSGIPVNMFQAQDLCVVEGAGPVQDRTQEHLAASDAAILMARRSMLNAIEAIARGEEPPRTLDSSEIVAAHGPLEAARDWRDLCRELLAEGRGWQLSYFG